MSLEYKALHSRRNCLTGTKLYWREISQAFFELIAGFRKTALPAAITVCAFLGISILWSGCSIIAGKSVPVSKQGVLDLRGYDFSASGPVSLAGEWNFFWGRLINPKEVRSGSQDPENSYMHIPGSWSNIKIEGQPEPVYKQMPGFGSATLTLRVLHDKPGIPLGVYIQEIETAFELFIDGERITGSGIVSDSMERHRPSILPRYERFIPEKSESVFVLHTSNYNDRAGGVLGIKIGLKDQIEDAKSTSIARDFLLFGSFALMGLYHLALFILNRKEKSALYFSLFCITLGIRTIIMGERSLHSFLSFLGYDALLKLEFLTIPIAAVFFSFYFSELFGYAIYDVANIVFLIGSVLISALVAVFPLVIYGEIFWTYHLLILALGGFIITGLVIAIREKKSESKVFLAGFALLFLTVANDILMYNKILNTGYVLPFGFILFIFAQAVILLSKLVRALSSNEKLSARLLSLDKLKDAFLANTSHELRTPLYGIIGLAEGMRDGKMGRLTDNQSRSLSLIISSGRRLANLVNDILDFSKMKKRQLVLNKRPVDMKEITDVVFVFSHPILSNKNVTLENHVPADFPLVDGDEMRLQQIMHNLIGNAIKFTESGSIQVKAEKRGHLAYISVSDTGIGIPGDKLEIIFESFEQLDLTVTRAYGGAGIGLAVVKQIVELHGGRVMVESEPGKGSTFTFTLPVSPVQEREETIEELTPARLIEVPDTEYAQVKTGEDTIIQPGGKRLVVLVVDDEPIHHDVIDTQLNEEQFDLTHVMNGKDAIEAALKTQFDVILLDIMMPGMSGYIVCKKIREKYAKHEVPIIILTAKNLLSDLVEALEAGANDYIAKPIRKSELVARIKTHVELSKVNLAYSRFVPRSFLKLLGRESIIDVERGDQVQLDMTICFCDIRSFMALSETLTPRENFNFLNSFFEKMAPIIKKHKGYIDKYIGDGIMALFPSHPEDALLAGLEMKKAINVYNGFRGKRGYNPISIGIGIHTGPIMLGTIGDETRMEGTVISDTVNIAARLEGLTKLYGGSIIISSEIFLSLEDPSIYNYRFLGRVTVKGKSGWVPVYEVFDTEESGQRKLQTKDFFEKALQAYFRKDFGDAEKGFFAVLELDPYDKASRLYYNRSKELKETGVPEEWDAHETMEYK